MQLLKGLVSKVRHYREDQAYLKKYQRIRTRDTDGYTLKSYDRYKCIFVHIPKNAGVSVTRSLFGNLGGGHVTALNYRRIFGQQVFDAYFKFTFARNPWARLYSAFHFLKKGGFDAEDAAWSKAHLADIDSFEQFVMEWLNEETLWSQLHFRPQWSFVCDEQGQLLVDYVGRVENLAEDYRYVCDRLGIDAQLEHLNASDSNSYIKGYNALTREKVATLYKKDIELFGYDFEGA